MTSTSAFTSPRTMGSDLLRAVTVMIAMAGSAEAVIGGESGSPAVQASTGKPTSPAAAVPAALPLTPPTVAGTVVPAAVPTSPTVPASSPATARPVTAPPMAGSPPTSAPGVGGSTLPLTGIAAPGEYTYNPSGRREPFMAIVKGGPKADGDDATLPPLQRISLTELNLIGIIWGGFGFTAMVQAPDGKGYALRSGTRIGPNNGVVSSITESAVVVQERFTDVYGNKQVREYVKLLHPKEGTE